jgi:GDPmannose 4,6-dehydratase
LRHACREMSNLVKKPTALIIGATGQDGAYLTRLLLTKGYRVVGTSRDAHACDQSRLQRLKVDEDIEIISLAPNDFRSVLKVVSSIAPDEIYNLAGQTSVSLSFEQPVECMESIAGGCLNVLEVIRFLQLPTRLFNAGSSECFGEAADKAADESTAMQPRSPYGVAKATAYWQIANYRIAYGLWACTGILANHESPLRQNRFVTQKIIRGVQLIKEGKLDRLELGNLEIWRDWGWAPEYVEAMHMMLQSDSPQDFLISSGETSSLREFVQIAFEMAGLIAEDYVKTAGSLMRPSDLKYSAMNPAKINNELGWAAKTKLHQIIEKMYHDVLF